jgi:single-strand DNA-binding protein
MNDINNLTITGRTTRDGELKYTSAGKPILAFSIAVNRSYRDKQGENVQNVSYFDVEYWGSVAESVAPYITKGKFVGITGRNEQQRWQDQNGNSRSKVVIVAERVELMGGNSNGNSNNGGSTGAQRPAPQESAPQYTVQDETPEENGGFPEDLPF